MPLVHIVLFKLKPALLSSSNGFEEFKVKCETLKETSIVKEVVREIAFGPPEKEDRAKGYNYGLYTKFDSREDLDRYIPDPGHTNFVKTVIQPNCDDVLAFDILY